MTKTWLLTLSAIAALLAMAPLAQAHVTVSADPVTEPVIVGQPFNVTVRFSEPCFEMPIEMATGNDELTAILDASAPAYATALSGETVPWTMEDCEPSTTPTEFGGLVRKAALVTVLVDASAPGLTNISLPLNYLNANGESSADPAHANITVAHYVNGSLHAMAATGMDDLMANESGHDGHDSMSGNASMSKELPIMLHFTYTTNAESLLTFEVTSSVGEVHEIDAIAVTPPSFDNKSEIMVMAMADFVPPASWESADLTFTAYLTPVVGGPRLEVASDSLMLTNQHKDNETDHDHGAHDHSEDESSIPSPAFAIVGLGLLAFAALRRR